MLCIFYDGKQCKICEGTPDYYVSDDDFSKLFNSSTELKSLDTLVKKNNGSILIGRLGVLKDGVYVENEKEKLLLEKVTLNEEKNFDFFASV